MRCLYCGKQLALFRRLTGSGEFCSDAHKQSYHDEYNKLALTRLIAAQTKTEDARHPSSSASTFQLASGDRQDAKTQQEPRRTGLHQRWGDLSTPKPRMLEAPPPEPPPPPAASFLIRKPGVARGLPIESPPTVIEAAESAPVSQKPAWTPVVAESQDPPHAAAVQNHMLPNLVESPSKVYELKIPEGLPPRTQLSSEISISPRPMAGLPLRPAASIDPFQFTGRPPAMAEQFVRFEDFRFAVMLFGSPELDVLADDMQRSAASVAELPADEPIDAPLWDSAEMVSTFARLSMHSAPLRGPSASSSLEALRMAATPPTPPRNAVETRSPDSLKTTHRTVAEMLVASVEADAGHEPSVSPDKPRPKLPTIPAAKSRRTPAMPSILQSPVESEPDQSQSLWGALRKYIKR